MRAYKHLFFDLDRTLYDFDTNNRDALRELYALYKLEENTGTAFDSFMEVYTGVNLSLWADYKKNLISKEELNLWRFEKTFGTLGITHPHPAGFAAKYLELSPLKTRLLPGTHEVLDYLGKRYRLHILTNGFEEVQYRKLDTCRLRTYFTTVITSEQAGARKPDPAIFRYALSVAGASPDEVLMIGDDPETDILGARQEGIDQVWLAQPGENSPIQPTYRIGRLEELKAFL